ncbi:hypothetical protein [Rhodanobacter sp. C05]|uniref:hypothetical protein n=1 Tax=Rhodanobacter sp. C05 TaxID=1945855 RepID=UPI0009C994E4|nr:hypothetical protein [Rhodanobacter sp. C05]OOG43482.1 hypothetical protein B0E51_01375 [Rhodanobacter sp. C05]
MTVIKQDTCQYEPDRNGDLIRKTMLVRCAHMPLKYSRQLEARASSHEAIVRSCDPAVAG